MISLAAAKSIMGESQASSPTDIDQQRQSFAIGLPIVIGLLLAVLPFIGKAAAVPFLLILLPLLLWTAFTDTERSIYVYITWCWIEGTMRGLFDDNVVSMAARDVILATILIGWLMQRIKTRDRDPLCAPPGSLLVSLFIIATVLQLFNPYTPGLVQSLAGLRFDLSTVPLFFIAYDVFRRPGQIRNLIVFLTLITLAIAVVSLVQYVFGREWTFSHYPGIEHAIDTNAHAAGNAQLAKSALFRPPGTTMFGGGSAVFVGLVFPLSFALMLLNDKTLSRPWTRLGVAALLLIFVVCVFINGVRLALVESIVGILISSALVGGRTRLRAVLALFACIVIGLTALVFSENISNGGVADRFASTFSDPDQALHSDRASLLDQFSDLVVESPMGIGLGRTGSSVGRFGDSSESTGFNDYSESYLGNMILETGIIGALLITLVAISFLLRGWKGLKRIYHAEDKILASCLLAVIAVIFIDFFYAPVLVAPPGSVLFWMLGPILLRCYYRSGKSLSDTR